MFKGHVFRIAATIIVGSSVALSSAEGADPLPETIVFNRDIRPILSDTCYKCHGPDKTQRKAELRLDTKAGVFADRDDYRILVAGDTTKSELFRRISTGDKDEHMPPTDSGLKLTRRPIELIRRWIAQGATWQKHWSFIAPKRPAQPKVKIKAWPRNGIDYFILARLERDGLTPSAEADKATLIRRVTLDLTGLPPTPAEVDAFLADKSPNAYEKVVDRLLKSPRYGERMAAEWLNAARYADTSGYQNDGPRYMWRWRDWVINAFNNNMPFDRFTIEQIAGDLMPSAHSIFSNTPVAQRRPSSREILRGAELERLVATAFNRNHRGNAEGGIIPEEYAVEYVVDRVETTSTVWLGLTLGCGRCHEHKYDPFPQKEFYQLFAYFNNVPEYGRAVKEGNSPPFIKAPTREQQKDLKRLEAAVELAESRFEKLRPKLAAAQAKWEQSVKFKGAVNWSISDGQLAHYGLNGDLKNSRQRETESAKDKSEKKGDGKAKVIEPSFIDGKPKFVTGRLGQSADFDGKRFINAGDVGKFGYFDKFSVAAWVYPHGPDDAKVPTGGTVISRMTDKHRADGYYVQLVQGKIQVNLVKRWLDDSIRVETHRNLEPNRWYHISVTYDGSRVAKGITVYVDGKPEKLKVNLDFINQSFNSTEPLRIGGGGGAAGRFHGLIDDVRVYNRVLSSDEAGIVATPDSIIDIVATAAGKRNAAQARKLRAYFLDNHAPREIRAAHKKLVSLRREQTRFVEGLPTLMVMQEMETPPDTHLLVRGQYDKPGEKVISGVPAVLAPLPKGAPNNRMGLARWLVDSSNPLTARVQVNRFWQSYFGMGLVKTVEDFGSQGDPPSHPGLLDWLATEFMRTGWDIKALQKTIVMSATYRQSSKVTPELYQKDPENRLLARGPRLRLSAETLRDQVLAISGLLVEKLGGPSVKPYQPAGLWKEIASDTNYGQSHGDDLYRRSLYTYWKRTVAPPTMMTFDASAREMCTVRQTRTNTPLQALTLLNEVTFVEAARVLAERMMTEGGATADERIGLGFRLATARRPRPAERKILKAGFDYHLSRYRKDRDAARKLVSVGEYRRNKKLDVSELAAYTTIASLILNLDETITKQ